MKKELIKNLQKEFSFIPSYDPLFRTDLKYPMHIDTDDGWFDLIHGLCVKIQREINKDPELKDKPERFRVVQIKEKFGGLRFYVGGGNKKIQKLIYEAEDKSFEICERCGKRGYLQISGGWYKTICKKCAAQSSKEKDRTWAKVTGPTGHFSFRPGV